MDSLVHAGCIPFLIFLMSALAAESCQGEETFKPYLYFCFLFVNEKHNRSSFE